MRILFFRAKILEKPRKLGKNLQPSIQRHRLDRLERLTVAWFVGQIGQLYAVEKKLREQKAGPALREAMRAWQSLPVLNRLYRAMELIRRKTLPQVIAWSGD